MGWFDALFVFPLLMTCMLVQSHLAIHCLKENLYLSGNIRKEQLKCCAIAVDVWRCVVQ